MACCCTQVEQSEVAIIEDCGKFDRIARPGCNPINCVTESVAGKMSLRLVEKKCVVESKTKDNVFVNLHITFNYQVIPSSVEEAFYSISDPVALITSYVYNSIRGKIPLYNLDELFQERASLSSQMKEEVDAQMAAYGYDIPSALISNVEPAPSVRDAINKIQMCRRMKTAAVDEAEAHKIRVVKAAEADAESKRLSGVGLAEQRKAIVAGLQESVEQFQQGVPGMSNDQIMSLLLLNQYFDTLKDVAQTSTASTLFLSHAGGLDQVSSQLTGGIISHSEEAKRK